MVTVAETKPFEPVPVLPRSLTSMSIFAVPANSAFGVNVRPSSAALRSVCEPVMTIVGSVVPSPTVSVRPVVPLRVNEPFDARRATRIGAVPASASVMLIALLFALLKVSATSSSVESFVGATSVGAMF